LRCRSCGREFSVDEVVDQLDDELAEQLGGHSADRV
jgi:hypothetical protein